MEKVTEIIRIGKVSSVNAQARTVRVIFSDSDNMVSAELPVLVNMPLISVTKTDDGVSWAGGGSYNSAPRGIAGASYKKELPDTITLQKEIVYGGETHVHGVKIEVHPWLPYVEQMVIAVFLPFGAGDGFIIGGL